jgi:hypothetical protein
MERYLAWIGFWSVLCCTGAAARPPAEAQPSAASTREHAIVGRVQLREGVVDLSLSSIAEGGAAHPVARGLAGVIADVDVRRPTAQDRPTAQASRDLPLRR